MNNLNSILIEGNLVRDPTLKSTPKGHQICSMKLASNRFYKMDSHSPSYEKETSYIDVDAWGKLAENCYAKGKKGRGVRVVGRIKQSRWNDSEGKPQSRITIVADHVEFKSEFRKDKNSGFDAVPVDSEGPYDGGYKPKTGYAMSDRELEPVVF